MTVRGQRVKIGVETSIHVGVPSTTSRVLQDTALGSARALRVDAAMAARLIQAPRVEGNHLCSLVHYMRGRGSSLVRSHGEQAEDGSVVPSADLGVGHATRYFPDPSLALFPRACGLDMPGGQFPFSAGC
jgi:hypothetical protein